MDSKRLLALVYRFEIGKKNSLTGDFYFYFPIHSTYHNIMMDTTLILAFSKLVDLL